VRYTAILGGKNVGHLTVHTKGDQTTVDWNVKDNGRGPTISEIITNGPEGLPTAWQITGTTTFGSKVDEHFSQSGGRAEWVDSVGNGSAPITRPALYITQRGSPWDLQVVLRALLKQTGMTRPALPGGTLRLEKGEALTVQGDGGPQEVTRYDLTGIDLTP